MQRLTNLSTGVQTPYHITSSAYSTTSPMHRLDGLRAHHLTETCSISWQGPPISRLSRGGLIRPTPSVPSTYQGQYSEQTDPSYISCPNGPHLHAHSDYQPHGVISCNAANPRLHEHGPRSSGLDDETGTDLAKVPTAFHVPPQASSAYQAPRLQPHTYPSTIIPQQMPATGESIHSMSELATIKEELEDGNPSQSGGVDQAPSSDGDLSSLTSQPFQARKPKRRRADARQLRLLNEVYARTSFPSTEARMELGRHLGMTARQVQIW